MAMAKAMATKPVVIRLMGLKGRWNRRKAGLMIRSLCYQYWMDPKEVDATYNRGTAARMVMGLNSPTILVRSCYTPGWDEYILISWGIPYVLRDDA
jgi:hypothetical protein